jgi:hypothetical protein
MVGVGHAAIGDVDRDDADPAARRRDRPRLRVRKPGLPGEPFGDVVQAGSREDRDAIPGRLAMKGDLISAAGEIAAEELHERVVRDLRLLKTDDVRLAIVEPRKQSRDTLLDRIDVPGSDPHGVPYASWSGPQALRRDGEGRWRSGEALWRVRPTRL